MNKEQVATRAKGRPDKYDYELLKSKLSKYAIKHKGTITFSGLEKETGIKRHVWSRRMKKEINILNNKNLSIKGANFEKIELPNITEIIDKHFNNKESLLKAMIDYNDFVQSLWEKAILQEKAEERENKLKQRICELEEENKFIKENRDFYKDQYEKAIVESTYYSKQVESGVSDKLDTDNLSQLSGGNWEEQFPQLFNE